MRQPDGSLFDAHNRPINGERVNDARVMQGGRELITQFRKELREIRSEHESRLNASGFSGLLDNLGIGCAGNTNWSGAPQTISGQGTIVDNNAYNPISLNRILLSFAYMTQGLFRTFVDQPVEDAFRGGIGIKCPELDDEDIKLLMTSIKRQRGRKELRKFKRSVVTTANWSAGVNTSSSDLEVVKKTCKWARLYGGAGIIVNTDQDYRLPLEVDQIKEDSPLMFIDADRWELVLSTINIWDERTPQPFNYYGLPVHSSRVVKILWAEAPSYIRLRLQGWGMSALEDVVRAVNSFLKFETLMFELLDEAKIDVYRIHGFNTALSSDMAMEAIMRRVTYGNQLKNFQNAISMDMEDDYQQKQLNFSGLSEIWQQLRLNLCAYIKFPMNKLFGESAGGFGSGKDSLENYNSIVGNLREYIEPSLLTVLELRCQQLFGFIPDDLEVEWKPLTVLDGVQEEQVQDSRAKRVFDMFDRNLVGGKEASEQLKGDGVLKVDTEVLRGEREVEPPVAQMGVEGGESFDSGGNGKKSGRERKDEK